MRLVERETIISDRATCMPATRGLLLPHTIDTVSSSLIDMWRWTSDVKVTLTTFAATSAGSNVRFVDQMLQFALLSVITDNSEE